MAIKRRRPKLSGPKSNLIYRRGIAWFSPENHARMMEIMVQPHDVPALYDRWRDKAESEERIWKRQNHLVVRITIDPKDFTAWCSSGGLKPDGDTLGRYVFERTAGDEYMARLRATHAR